MATTITDRLSSVAATTITDRVPGGDYFGQFYFKANYFKVRYLHGALTVSSTSTDRISGTPGRQHFHPGHPKCWCVADSAGAIAASYNITSVTDVDVGTITFTIATDFSSANWAASLNVRDTQHAENGALLSAQIISQAAGTIGAVNVDVADADASVNVALNDPIQWHLIGCGDQA